MTTLSSNYYGKVTIASNAGFSVKNATSKIESEVSKLGLSTEKEIAKTGTTYITIFDLNDLSVVTIRVSNHTKRGVNVKDMETFIYTSDRFDKKVIESCNVCNSKMLQEFISNIPTVN
jgi:hypothetical protein